MSVLDRDKFFQRINDMVGTDATENSVSFIEDMTDTYNHLENVANGDGIDWQQRYNDLDASWRKKYQERFFSSNGNSVIPSAPNNPSVPPERVVNGDNITIDDLFN